MHLTAGGDLVLPVSCRLHVSGTSPSPGEEKVVSPPTYLRGCKSPRTRPLLCQPEQAAECRRKLLGGGAEPVTTGGSHCAWKLSLRVPGTGPGKWAEGTPLLHLQSWHSEQLYRWGWVGGSYWLCNSGLLMGSAMAYSSVPS